MPLIGLPTIAKQSGQFDITPLTTFTGSESQLGNETCQQEGYKQYVFVFGLQFYHIIMLRCAKYSSVIMQARSQGVETPSFLNNSKPPSF